MSEASNLTKAIHNLNNQLTERLCSNEPIEDYTDWNCPFCEKVQDMNATFPCCKLTNDFCDTRKCAKSVSV